MVGAITTVLLPWKWPGAIIRAPFWVADKAVSWTVSAVKTAWKKLPKPKSTVGKAIVYPVYGFIALPGTVPWMMYKMGEFMGYGPELQTFIQDCMTFFGGATTILIDAVGKLLFYVTAVLAGMLF